MLGSVLIYFVGKLIHNLPPCLCFSDGDLKPGNVLLKKDSSSKTGFVAKVKLLTLSAACVLAAWPECVSRTSNAACMQVGDFGLAQRCGPGAPPVQQDGVPLGTLCYAAPEALRGVLHKSSDVGGGWD